MINKKVILRSTRVPAISLAEWWSIGVLAYMKKDIKPLSISPVLQHSSTPIRRNRFKLKPHTTGYLLLVHRSEKL